MKRILMIIFASAMIVSPDLLRAQDDTGYVNPPYEYDVRDMLESLTSYKRAGQTVMPFLAAGAGAKNLAMADAVMAQQGDATSLFYNPAGIAYLKGRSVFAGNMVWLIDSQIQSAALAWNFGNFGSFGLSAMYVDYGDPITATEIDATTPKTYRIIGEMNPVEMVFGIAYAREISSQFAIGGQVKYAYQDLLGSGGVSTRIAYRAGALGGGAWVRENHDAKGGIFAFDFGTIYNTGFRDLTFAMSFRNFGGEIKYESEAYNLPLQFRFGMTASLFQMLAKSRESMDFRLNVDYLHSRDWSERVLVGGEYSFFKMFFLRGGYKFNYTSEGLCLGAGARIDVPTIGVVNVDYAYKDTNDTLFETVHVYSMNIEF